MAYTERCLMGLLAGVVVFLVATALRLSAVDMNIARVSAELPAIGPKQIALSEIVGAPQETAADASSEPVPRREKSRRSNVRRTSQPDTTALEVIQLPPPAADGAAADITAGRYTSREETAALALASRPSAYLLSEAFGSMGYNLKSVGGGDRVPRLFLTNVPHDMESLREVQMRKSVFLKAVLPLILQVNEEITQERRLLWRLHQKIAIGTALRAAELQWLESMADRYGVEDANVDILLRKVDVIPPSLALAQAAEESGWGTSRYARESNALFGEGAFGDGRSPPVRAFDNLLDAVRGYARNLNSHNAYRDFRIARSTMRQRGKPLDGHTLAGFILRYSERGESYIKSLRVIISANDLRGLDAAELHGDLPIETDHLADPTT